MKVAIELQGLIDDGLIEMAEVRYRRDPETLQRNGLVIKYEDYFENIETLEVDFDADAAQTTQ